MRTIDKVITFIDDMDSLSPVEKRILKQRIEVRPTDEEVTAARLALTPPSLDQAPDGTSIHPWYNTTW